MCLSLSGTAWADAGAQDGEADPFAQLEYRSVGPYNMSGRVSDVESIPGDPRTVYVGSASGGVWRSLDGGLTFAPIFDDQSVASIGDMALAPNQPAVLYVGTGESNVRNSVSFGNGVYRSTDGGESWQHLGLEGTQTISRIAVHPKDPDTVYVGALGPIYGPSEERGVFRSTDGGTTWEKVLYISPHHGVADLDLDPTNPKILFAAMWRFERRPWTHRSGGEDGGVYRSLDGGTTWERLDDNGLPKAMGRIAVKIAPSQPQTVYVLAESNDGILFRSDDRGETFHKVSDDTQLISRGFYYTDLRVDPTDANRVFAIASRLFRSIDGGKTFERFSQKTHVDYHSLWIDPQNPNRMWQGQDGGVAVSYNRGDTWEPIRSLPLAQFYQVFADTREPFYYLGGGLQDNGTWYGPSQTREPVGILQDNWRMLSFGDAYFVVPHPEQVDFFISEFQAGGILRTDMRNRQQVDISPQPRRNDGGPVEDLEYRFNWNAPIIASPHDPLMVYFAGNVVFRSPDFGETWEVISPDLTTDDPAKQGAAGGPVWFENTTAEYHCTIISFAESPAEPGVLWAGTDDGNLQRSRDHGKTWDNLTANVKGVPEFSPVSHVEPSAADAGTVYIAFDRHMWNDFRPHVYRTTDSGKTWRRITDGLPESGWVWVVREDPRQPSVLYAGTELGLYVSWDRGDSWQKLHLGNFPAVAVHDVLVHPRENDLIVGTHGRGIWVFDDATPIQQWTSDTAKAALFPVRPALQFSKMFTRYGLGDKIQVAPNPPYGALITYHLPAPPEGAADPENAKAWTSDGVQLEILDASGEVVQSLKEIGRTSGLHRAAWNLRYDPPRPRDESADGNEFFGPPVGPNVLPGTYTARLTVGAEVLEQSVEVILDPTLGASPGGLERLLEARLRIREQRSRLNDALRLLDALEAQLGERRSTLDTLKISLSDELDERWKAFEEKRQAIEDALIRDPETPRWSRGPELADLLGDFARNLDAGFRAPTTAQEELLDEITQEFEASMARFQELLRQDLVELNGHFQSESVPELIIPPESAD